MDTGHSRPAGLPGGSGNPVGPDWASDQGDGGSGGQHLFNLIPFCSHGQIYCVGMKSLFWTSKT